MLPNAHAKSVSDVSVKFSTESLHTAYPEVINPSSNELIEFHHLIAVTNTPATTGEFSHSLLKLFY